MTLSAEHLAIIETQRPVFEQARLENKVISPTVWTFLQASEQQLIDLMNNQPPGPDAAGNVEASWALYFLNNDSPGWLQDILRWFGMPASQVTPADWTQWQLVWQNEGVLMGDGSFVSEGKFAVMDIGWSLAIINTLLIELKKITPYTPFGTSPQTLAVSGRQSLSIAVFGDWGTGSYADGHLSNSPSQLVGQQVTAQKPDISIHIGDVYYVGSAGEEQANLLNCWPKAATANFTLNSNHEMYSGGAGLFGTTLQNPIFSGQNKTTYFQIEFGNWLIIGLDSAYYDTSFMYMDGALIDPNQVSFLKTAGQSTKQLALFTHHNPISTNGTVQTALWGQVVNALGRAPELWYWGHVHNGIVYSAQSAAGAATACRCLGNAAIPIGNASWLADPQAPVTFYTHQALPDPQLPQQQLRVMNAFALLTFSTSGVTEEWYNQDGSKAWSNG